MMTRKQAAMVLLLGLGGCVHYAPKPQNLGSVAARHDARSGSLADAVKGCRKLVATGRCDFAQPDRLLLYAALLRNNPAVAAARAHVESAAAAARASRVWAGPKLTLTAEYAGAAPDPSPWLFGVGSDIPLDLGGVRSSRTGSADLAVVAARYDLIEAVWTARMAMTRALAGLLLAERQSAAADDLAALQQRRFDAMQRRVMAGEASRAELERVRADLADAHRRQQDAAAKREASIVALAAATGLPERELSGKAFTWDGFDAPFALAPIDGETRRAALLARADLLKSITAYDTAELDLRSEVAKQYPQISIGPGFTWERGLIKIPFNLGLSLPPFDLNRGAIAAAEARRSEAGARLEADYAAAVNAVDAALAEARAARSALAAIEGTDTAIAARLAAQATRELAAGATDRTEWAAAEAGKLTTRLAELDALARVLAADAALEDALRRPLSGPETMIEGTRR